MSEASPEAKAASNRYGSKPGTHLWHEVEQRSGGADTTQSLGL